MLVKWQQFVAEPGDNQAISSRQVQLDSLRGLAALIVVFVHYLAAFLPYSVFGDQDLYQQHLALENILLFPPFGLLGAGDFAVCLFFILSGYVLSYKLLGAPLDAQKLLALVAKRPVRLGGLVYASVIICAAFWYFDLFANRPVSEITTSQPWLNNRWAGQFNVPQFWRDLLSPFYRGNFYNPPLWTIKIELYGSFLVYLFILIFGRAKFRLMASIVLIFLFKDSLFQGFWIGLAVADIVKHHPLNVPEKSKKMIFYSMAVAFIYFSSYPSYMRHEFLEASIYSVLPDDNGFGGGYPMLAAALIFILAVSSARLKRFLCTPVLKFLGDVSYGLYVMHFVVIGSFSSWLFLRLHDSIGYSSAFLIVLISGITVCISLAYFVTRYIDNPAITFANYIAKKTTNLANKIKFTNTQSEAERMIAGTQPKSVPDIHDIDR